MKYIWLLHLILIGHIMNAQQLGSISSASQSFSSPYTVGEIYVEGSLSGYVGVYSFLIGNGLLSSSIDVDVKDDFTIIPNPTEGRFEIKTTASGINNIKVLDTSGKILKTFVLQGTGDISDLAPGLYFIQINHKNAFKIIKN